jgi:spermidine synthase
MKMPHHLPPRRLLLAFTLSGISALIYEVVWIRLLGDLFGHTAYAIQVVLAVFFGGLAAGSFLSDRVGLRRRRALRIYAVIELLVGAAALLFPFLVGLITPLYDRYAPLELETGTALIFRLAVALILLIIPTALMGATFPLVVRWQSSRDETRSGVAILYAANTLGGALGTWVCAFILMPLIGVRLALVVSALGNFIAAALAFSLDSRDRRPAESVEGSVVEATRKETPSDASVESAARPFMSSVSTPLLAALLFLTGFVAISLEVIWTRALDQVLSGTIYSFATVLTVFLLGIALGSWLYRSFLKSFSPFSVFVAVETLLANYVLASLFLIYIIPGVSRRLGEQLGMGFVRRGVILESIISALILLVPALCMGVIFPLLLNAARGRDRSAPPLGLLVAANTVGSVAGPLVAGFYLLPRFGLMHSLLIMAGISVALAGIVSALLVRRSGTWALVGTGVAIALVLLILSPGEIRIWGEPGERLIDYREDPAATVSVVESGGHARERKLKVNNTYSLGGGRGVFTERRQGHLPMLMHPSPQRVLVLGVGTANTLGAVSLYRPSRLLAVDLVPGVLEFAKKHFGATNYRVLENPRVEVISADALRIARATPEKYDVVVADLFHPWQAGVGSLYSTEHFRATRRTLAEGGIFCQWLPLYQLSEENLKIIVRTFLDSYPQASAWLGNFGTSTPILALIGSEQPVELQWKRWEDALDGDELSNGLKAVYLDQPAEVLGGYVGGRDDLERFAGQGMLNSIERPAIEFSAPATLFNEGFEPAKRRTLEALIGLRTHQRIPVSFDGAQHAIDEGTISSNREAVRLMIQAMLESEKGEKEKALRTAIQSARSARGYNVPAAILVELAWKASEDFPAVAEQGFHEALQVRPDDANAITGLGHVYLSLRRPDDAIELFQKALKISPDWPEAAEGLEKAKRVGSNTNK